MNNSAVKEIQVNSDGSLEVSYSGNSPEGAILLAEAGIYMSDKIEMVSKSDRNIVVVETAYETEDYCDYYATKYDLINGFRTTKIYSKKFWKLPNIQLPKGSRLANQFGIGFMPINGTQFRYDVYFFHDNQAAVEKHFGSFIACEDLAYVREEFGLYGITYAEDQTILNLKRYMYPFDPFCKNPDHI